MVDGSVYEVIDTRTIKVIERDRMVHALEAVSFVPEHGTILYHKDAQQRRMPDPIATRHRHS